jgi:glycosyltransferase involved in cell wall biosynthesis
VRLFHVRRAPSRLTRTRKAAKRMLREIFSARKSAPAAPPAGAANEIPWYPFERLEGDFVRTVERHLVKGCDIFQAEFADLLTLGPLVGGRVPALFVHHQLHFVYARRFLAAVGGGSVDARYVTERMIREEAAYLRTFDSTIVFSEVDRAALREFCPALDVRVSPFPGPEDPVAAAPQFVPPVTRFVIVASESHRPNYDGLCWFMQSAWPEIKRARPDASLEVIGRWSPAGQATLPNGRDICFSGFLPELVKSLQNKVMIVPLRIGSGIRSKILAAWAAGCPVVTTAVGVEGLPGKPGEDFVVADDPRAFAGACLGLSQDVGQLNRLAANGLRLLQQHYSLSAVRQTRLEIYQNLLAAPRPGVSPHY